MDSTNETAKPSGASGGSATFTVEDVGLLYDEWKRLHCGPRRMVSLIRKPYWKKVLSVPWLWWTHFGTACQHATVFQSAGLATLFVYAFLKTCK